ncbi:MAG: hypothetical protein PUE61_01060 [Clostridiales bacterium]|nr:hypothetical protein [Clostridiales bacterium]
MSRIRKIYFARLIGRCLVLIACALLCIFSRQSFDVLPGLEFFRRLSPLHFLWGVWMMDIILQLIPAKNDIALGSKKLFRQYFRPSALKEDLLGLKRYILSTTRSAYKILIIWALLITGLGILHFHGLIGDIALFMVSVAFYVCDLICVLIWCPFRLLLKNRCCTTCRIFNWDHLMMFTPMLFVRGFYARSLLIMSIVVFIAWELSVVIHPERFWFQSNETLQCANCTDKLCTQYCQKLRPKKDEELEG